MSEPYGYSMVPKLTADGSVVWNQEPIDGSLSETINDGYVTAEEDTTQYLSVLDNTSDISLETLNITLSNPKLEIQEPPEQFITETEVEQECIEDSNEQQVVVFSVEGSDELYGIQIVQDEEGNFQKYQFQFTRNEDGQLEAIPETIQLLPMDEEREEGANPEVVQDEGAPQENQEEQGMQMFAHENNPHQSLAEQSQNEEEHELEESTVIYEEGPAEDEDTQDIKPSLLSLNEVKQELQDPQLDYENHFLDENTSTEPSEPQYEPAPDHFPDDNTMDFDDHLLEPPHEEPVETQPVQDEEINYQYVDNINEEINIEYQEQPTKDQPPEETPPPDDDADDDTALERHQEPVYLDPEQEPDFLERHQEPVFNIQDSDMEDYQIVEGVHITGDLDASNGERTTPNNTNILRHALKTKEPNSKKENKMYIYVVQHPEKENVEALAVDVPKSPKPNPRSILKSSYVMLQSKNESDGGDERLNKRFARGKEAMQARLFHNFINKTTIPQAPIRKEKLPRKQQIKPVDRLDEEIVVQEVMVSSNGFVEPINGTTKDRISVTEYVELTDSDDDYNPKKKNSAKIKARKSRRKRVEIMISDDESDDVIELDESDDDYSPEVPKSLPGGAAPAETTPPKRRRGRPPKNRPSTDEPSHLESPLKKMRLDASEPERNSKPEIPCPKCDKSFPSQNSLKTHLQHHSLESSMRAAPPPSAAPDKYKCDDCGSCFKNGILLKRHVCVKAFACSVCKKRFPDATKLSIHKRVHAKEQLIKNTSNVSVSPKRIKRLASPATFKVPPRKVNALKCKTCGRVCPSMALLSAHLKTHKESTCTTCGAAFVSRIMLEKHVREKCVKSPLNNRRSMRLNVTTDGAAGSAVARVSCDECDKKFATYKAMFSHKVVAHNLDTPDKSAMLAVKRKTLHREKHVHGGVPASMKLRNAFAELRQLTFNNK